jgi:hypothetical protein
MLALAITALFTFAAIAAAVVIADSLVKARAAYLRLLREGEVLRAGFALKAAAVEMSLRPAPRPAVGRAMAARRPAPAAAQPRPRAHRACVAA